MKIKISKYAFSAILIITLILTTIPVLSIQPVAANGGIPGARSQMVGGELFLGGNYIELGISQWGDFGTEGDRPTGFYGTDVRDNIGMSADHDGFNYGFDHRIDYFLPGTPEERFAVGYKVGSNTYSNSNSAVRGDKNMPTVVTDESSGDLLKANIVSTWAGTMEIKQVVSFEADQKFFRNEVTIKNISGSAWDGARYMRSFDPDNTVDIGMSFTTDNTVTHTIAEDGKAVVKAQTIDDSDPIYEDFGSRAPIFFYSKDASAVASACSNSITYAAGNDGFTNRNPYDTNLYENPSAKNTTIRQDMGITIIFDSGLLASGKSKTFIYYTSLDERDFAEVEEEIEPLPPVINSIDPDWGRQGKQLTVVITGNNFSGTTAVSFGAGITVNSFTVDSPDKITVEISIAGKAAEGFRDVSVTNADGTTTFEDGFQVYEESKKPWEGLSEAPTVGKPANIAVRGIWTSQQTAYANQPVVIYANASNSGDLPGNTIVTLTVNGKIVENREVLVQGNAATPLNFTVTPTEPGTYTVDVNGQQAYFTVVSSKEATSPTTVVYTILGILVSVAIILGIMFAFRRGFSR